MKPCRYIGGGNYLKVGELCNLPIVFDKSFNTEPGTIQFTPRAQYIQCFPEDKLLPCVPGIEQWEPDGPWRIVLHVSSEAAAKLGSRAFEYAGPFDSLEAAVIAFMFFWPRES